MCFVFFPTTYVKIFFPPIAMSVLKNCKCTLLLSVLNKTGNARYFCPFLNEVGMDVIVVRF